MPRLLGQLHVHAKRMDISEPVKSGTCCPFKHLDTSTVSERGLKYDPPECISIAHTLYGDRHLALRIAQQHEQDNDITGLVLTVFGCTERTVPVEITPQSTAPALERKRKHVRLVRAHDSLAAIHNMPRRFHSKAMSVPGCIRSTTPHSDKESATLAVI